MCAHVSVCVEANSSVSLSVQASSALFHLGCLCSLHSSGYLASAFCLLVAFIPGTLSPLVRIKGLPCRPLCITPSHILCSSRLANTQSSLSKLPLSQSMWPPKETDQPQTRQSCLPSWCSCLSWAKQLCHLSYSVAFCYMCSHHREISILFCLECTDTL